MSCIDRPQIQLSGRLLVALVALVLLQGTPAALHAAEGDQAPEIYASYISSKRPTNLRALRGHAVVLIFLSPVNMVPYAALDNYSGT